MMRSTIKAYLYIVLYILYLNTNVKEKSRASRSCELQIEQCQMIGNLNQKPRNQLSRCAPAKRLSDLRLLRLLSAFRTPAEKLFDSAIPANRERSASRFALPLSCTESLRDWCLVKCDLQV